MAAASVFGVRKRGKSNAKNMQAYGTTITDPAAIALIERIRAKHTNYTELGSCPDTVNAKCDHVFECNCWYYRGEIMDGNYEKLNAELDKAEREQEELERKINARAVARRERRKAKQANVAKQAKLASQALPEIAKSLVEALEQNDNDKFNICYRQLTENVDKMRKQRNYQRDGPY